MCSGLAPPVSAGPRAPRRHAPARALRASGFAGPSTPSCAAFACALVPAFAVGSGPLGTHGRAGHSCRGARASPSLAPLASWLSGFGSCLRAVRQSPRLGCPCPEPPSNPPMGGTFNRPPGAAFGRPWLRSICL